MSLDANRIEFRKILQDLKNSHNETGITAYALETIPHFQRIALQLGYVKAVKYFETSFGRKAAFLKLTQKGRDYLKRY